MENTNHDVFGPNEMAYLCIQTKNWVEPVGHGHVFCSPFYCSSWWRRLQFLIEEKKVAYSGEGKEVEVREEEALEVERLCLLYTRAPDHYQQKPQTKRQKVKSVVEKAVHLRWKELSFSEASEIDDHDATREVNTTHPGRSKSDVKHSDASAIRVLVQIEERGTWF